MGKSSEVEIAVQVIAVTEKALLITSDGANRIWIPKSQISDYAGSEDLDSKVTSIFVSEWLATEKGLV